VTVPPASAQRIAIISGPSGAGKSTIVRRLLAECDLPFKMSVSATTRSPRPGENPGVDYHFLTLKEFSEKRKAGEFLEYKEVFRHGDWYGTLQSEVSAGLSEGKWVVLEIDVQGAMSVLETYPNAATFFVHPGSLEELEKRLRDRKTETESSIARRLATAQREMDFLSRYTHPIVNDSVDRAVQEMCDILKRLGE